MFLLSCKKKISFNNTICLHSTSCRYCLSSNYCLLSQGRQTHQLESSPDKLISPNAFLFFCPTELFSWPFITSSTLILMSVDDHHHHHHHLPDTQTCVFISISQTINSVITFVVCVSRIYEYEYYNHNHNVVVHCIRLIYNSHDIWMVNNHKHRLDSINVADGVGVGGRGQGCAMSHSALTYRFWCGWCLGVWSKVLIFIVTISSICLLPLMPQNWK